MMARARIWVNSLHVGSSQNEGPISTLHDSKHPTHQKFMAVLILEGHLASLITANIKNTSPRAFQEKIPTLWTAKAKPVNSKTLNPQAPKALTPHAGA